MLKNFSDKKIFVVLTFVIWTFVALLDFARAKIMLAEITVQFQSPIAPNDWLVSALIKFYIWFFFGILIYDLFYKIKKKKVGVQVLLFVALGLVSVSIHYMIGNLSWNYYLTGTEDILEKFRQAMRRFFSNLPMSSLNYATILLMITTLDLNRKYREQRLQALTLESKLSETQLQNLKMQLRPHFMFNALNTISMLVRRERNPEAVEMVSGMSDLLRTTLSREETQLVRLSYELELLKKYLAIEQTRFKERLTIDFQIEPECLEAMVPNLILQPIVENAFKHGFAETLQGASITISARKSGDQLMLSVVNSGPSLPNGWRLEESQGIGIKNTISRLKGLFDSEGKFAIQNEETGGVNVTMQFPYKRFES